MLASSLRLASSARGPFRSHSVNQAPASAPPVRADPDGQRGLVKGVRLGTNLAARVEHQEGPLGVGQLV